MACPFCSRYCPELEVQPQSCDCECHANRIPGQKRPTVQVDGPEEDEYDDEAYPRAWTIRRDGYIERWRVGDRGVRVMVDRRKE